MGLRSWWSYHQGPRGMAELVCGSGVLGKCSGCGWPKLGRCFCLRGPVCGQGSVLRKLKTEDSSWKGLLQLSCCRQPLSTPTRPPEAPQLHTLEEASGPTTYTVHRAPHPLSPCTAWTIECLPRLSLSCGAVRGGSGICVLVGQPLGFGVPAWGLEGGDEVINTSPILSPSLLRSQGSEVWAY